MFPSTNLKMDYISWRAKLFCLTLIFIKYSATAKHHSSLLSRIYRKAAEQAKPLVLVLDTANYETLTEAARSKKQTRIKSRNVSIKPFLYLYQLGQKSYPVLDKNTFNKGTAEDKVRYHSSESKNWMQNWAKQEVLKNRYIKDRNLTKGIVYKGPKTHQKGDDTGPTGRYLRQNLVKIVDNSPALGHLLETYNAARQRDEDCSASEKEDDKSKQLCEEYVKNASECTGVDFNDLLKKKDEDTSHKLPSTMGGILIHEIDRN